jgi:hypothetical protein
VGEQGSTIIAFQALQQRECIVSSVLLVSMGNLRTHLVIFMISRKALVAEEVMVTASMEGEVVVTLDLRFTTDTHSLLTVEIFVPNGVILTSDMLPLLIPKLMTELQCLHRQLTHLLANLVLKDLGVQNPLLARYPPVMYLIQGIDPDRLVNQGVPITAVLARGPGLDLALVFLQVRVRAVPNLPLIMVQPGIIPEGVQPLVASTKIVTLAKGTVALGW